MSLGVEVGGAGEQQGMGKRYPQQPTVAATTKGIKHLH